MGRPRHGQELKLTEKKLKINYTKYNKAQAFSMLDNYVYKDKLRLCNSYFLFSAKMVVLTCLKYYFVGMLPIFWKDEPVYKNEYSTLAERY